MRRRPVVVQRRGPGLLGTIARTAVVAGTATATSRAINNSMDNAAQGRQQQQMAEAQSQADLEQMQSQLAALQAQQVQSATAAPPAQNAMLEQLQQLAQLKESGVLSEDEFQAAKAKLLNG